MHRGTVVAEHWSDVLCLITNQLKIYGNNFSFQKSNPTPAWSAQIEAKGRAQEWRMQRSQIANLPKAFAFSARHFHNIRGHPVAMDSDCLRPQLHPVVVVFRRYLVADRFHPRRSRACSFARQCGSF